MKPLSALPSILSEDFQRGLKLADEPVYMLAKRVGTSPATLTYLLKGVRTWPTRKTRRRIEALGKLLNLKPAQCWATPEPACPPRRG